MQNFSLYNPVKVIFGKGSIERIGKYARAFGKRAMIVIGQGSARKNGYLDKVTKQLKNAGIEFTVFEGIEPNPRVTTIDRAKKAAYKFKANFLLALGGGSVIDAAKGISISYFDPESSVWDYVYLQNSSKKSLGKILPIITVPTIAATGSEMDQIAVITNWKENKKLALFNEKIFPSLSIVDPELTYTVNKKQTAYGGVDIITHISESYFNSKEKAPIQDGFTETIFKTVLKYVPIALHSPKNYEARENISYSSTLALNGIINNGRGRNFTMHAIEHTLSAYLDIPHGLGLALIMPSYLRYIAPHNPEKFYDFAVKIMGIPQTGNREETIRKGIKKYENWQKDIGITETLSNYVSDEKMLRKFARETIKIKNSKNEYIDSVIPLYEDDIVKILSNQRQQQDLCNR